MRILLISSECYNQDCGGIGIYIHCFCKELIERGHHVSLITGSNCNLESEAILEKMDIHYIPLGRIPLISVLLWSFSSYLLFIKLNKKYKYDIINPHLPSSYFYSLFYHGRAPLVLTIHNSLLGRGKRNVSFANKSLSIVRDILSTYNSDKVICLNEDLAAKLCSFPFVNFNKIYRIPLGINLDDYIINKASKIENINRNLFTVLFVGRIHEVKGLDYLLEAIVKLNNPSIELIIVGDGPLKKYYESKYKNLNNISFLGRIDDRDMLMQIYNKSDVCVIPSFMEGMPTVLLEAMASGLPIIATKIPGIEDVVTSKFCKLVKVRNDLEISNAISELFNDSKLKKSMGEEAFKEAKKYDWKIIINDILNIFELALVGSNLEQHESSLH